MNKFALLTIAFAGIGMFGCATDSASPDDGDQAQDAQADTARAEVAPLSIGAKFHIIRLANTTECVQPLGGQTANSPLEIRTCIGGTTGGDTTPAQNWELESVSGGMEFVNNISGKCLWAFGSTAINGNTMGQLDCDVSNTSTPASNALWKPSASSGNVTIQSLLGHKNTGLCLDIQNSNPFDGASMQLSPCDGRPSEIFNIGQG